jgi:hypothetical protein
LNRKWQILKWLFIFFLGGGVFLFVMQAARDLNDGMARLDQSKLPLKSSTLLPSKDQGSRQGESTDQTLVRGNPQPLIHPSPSQVGRLKGSDTLLEGKDSLNQKKLLKLFEEKKYQEAYDFAEQLKKSSGPKLKKWLSDQTPVLLTALGWMFVGNKQCPRGVTLFHEALALREEVEALRGLVVCAHEAGRQDEVLSLSDRLMEVGVKDPLVLSLRSDALESDGRFAEARELFQGNEEKKRALERRLELSERQTQARGNHFQITFESKVQEFLVDDLISFLEDCLAEFNQLGFPFPTRTIEVVLYQSRDFVGVAGGQPNWAEGLFDGRMRIPVSQDWKAPQKEMRFAMVLKHELTHALLHESGRKIPVWLDEGLAQRMACMEWGCQAVGGRSKFHQMGQLEGPFIGLKAEDARTAYQQSLYLIYSLEALLSGQGGLKEVVEAALLGGGSKQIFERLGVGSWEQIYNDVSKKYEQGVQLRPQ